VKKGWIVKDLRRMKKTMLMAALAMVGAGGWVKAQTVPQLSPATAEAERVARAQNPTAVPDPFPPMNPKNFTADEPTPAVVNDFLKTVWGYNQDLSWRVEAIQKTTAPGVVRVTVFVRNKRNPGKVSRNEFFITPDGKHAIADAVLDFGAKPYAERRKTLQDEANGAAEGAAGKELLLVEFGDLLNGQSKAVHDSANKLQKDFPQARLVFENVPSDGNVYALRVAREGVCVRKAMGDAAFFLYADAVYNRAQGLTAATLEQVLSAAVTTAGGDVKTVAACADSQAARDDVNASIALGSAVGIDQSAVIVVNGRVLPAANMPYETLKQIVAYQATLDGLIVHVQPTLSPLK
jgi:protein-disulfide isomerase